MSETEYVYPSGWLVNDVLTCIPGTETFWHMLLSIIPNLRPIMGGNFVNLGLRIAKIYSMVKSVMHPKYIIRNATYFDIIPIRGVYTISFLQDIILDKSSELYLQQSRVLKNSNIIVANSQFTADALTDIDYQSKIRIIPIGIDMDKFKPVIQQENADYVLPNSVLFIGSRNGVKNFNLLLEIISISHATTIFCLVMKDDTSIEHIPQEVRHKIKIFNRINHEELVKVINACKLGICTSTCETQHLSGAEIMACNKPVIATNVGMYYDLAKKKISGWGEIASTAIEFSQAITKAISNPDMYSPREILLRCGYDRQSCENEWKKLISTIS